MQSTSIVATEAERQQAALYRWMEGVIEQALADGFRGWIEVDDSFSLGEPVPIVRDVWRHDVKPERATRRRGIFFNMASCLPGARA